MTVAQQTPIDRSTANGVTTVFPYNFYLLDEDDLDVYLDDALADPSSYSVSGVGVVSGGNVTFLTAPASGVIVTRIRNVDLLRIVDYQNAGDFRADTVDADFDRIWMVLQGLAVSNDRALHIGISDSTAYSDLEIPAAADRAGQYFVYDGSGKPSIASGTGSDSALRTDLATASAGKGAELVAFTDTVVTAPAYLKTVSDMLNAVPVSALRFIPKASWSAINDYSSTTDVSSYLNEAFAAFEANGGGALDLTYGRYVIEDPLIVESNDFTIRGAGWGATHLYRAETATGDLIKAARPTPSVNQLRGFTLTDLCIWAGLDVSADASLHILNATRVAADRVFIRNCHRGLHLEGIRDSRFNALEIISNEHHTTTRSTSCHVLIDAPANVAVESTETFFSNFNFTTATGQPDLARSLHIRGALDGIWFQNGHMFGGDTAGCVIDGNSQAELQGLTFSHVWFDRFCARNLIIQGTAAADFRLLTFNDCRFWGGSTNNISTDSGSNVQDVTFNSCEIGVTLGQGLQVGAGQIECSGTKFKRLNQSVAANGYAAQVTAGAAAGTVLTVTGGSVDVTNLTYGIQCANTSREYHLNGITFDGDDSSLSAEIQFAGATLIGTCGGHTTARSDAGDITAGATTHLSNIASDSYNLVGSAANIGTVTPVWHGRRITLKADSANQNMVSGGNIRNKTNAASVTIVNSDMAHYEYSADTARWHEL